MHRLSISIPDIYKIPFLYLIRIFIATLSKRSESCYRRLKSSTALMSEYWHRLVMLDFVSENLYLWCSWIHFIFVFELTTVSDGQSQPTNLWVPAMSIFINFLMANGNWNANSLYWGYPFSLTSPAPLVTLYFVMQRRLHTVILYTLMRILARVSN